MPKIGLLPRGVTGRVTASLVVLVSLSILIAAGLGYIKLYEVTEDNSSVRIDRAARAAVALFTHELSSEFEAVRGTDGRPLAIRLKADTAETSLSFRDQHDALLKEIGGINQGAANLFRFNPETAGFDRFATTFRKPDGSMPPPMSITPGHPAYARLSKGEVHLGEVPVMGRMRLAYLTPIVGPDDAVKGALAVDVGWADDLILARTELRSEIGLATLVILLLVTSFGAIFMGRQLRPVRVLARYADDLATHPKDSDVPFRSNRDEFGTLALALERLVALKRRLARLAYTDEITGFGNRSRYLADLETAVAESQSGSANWVLLHLDLDNFLQITEAYGQINGDKLLAEIANQISRVTGPGARLARRAGDEFTILVDDRNTADEVGWLADNLLDTLRQPVQLGCGVVHTTASIGIVELSSHEAGAEKAHLNAELARRKARREGGNRAVVFTSQLNAEEQHRFELEDLLRSAIADQDLDIHFQPQIDPKTHELRGLEALVRWTDPTRGPIPPGEFIPVAEASGQIVELGTVVLELACAQAAKWRRSGFDFNHISVNVSPIQLWQCNFLEIVRDTLKRHELPGADICIEITESVFVDNGEERIGAVLAGLRALGVRISLDDFGSGYSSLGYLNQLPFDQLKVDRCFITDIDRDVRKQKVLHGIVGLARGLGFQIVVEGAETPEEVTIAEQMGCDAVQGYYFARPAPALLIPDMVAGISRAAPAPPALKTRSARTT
ncbi:MAG: EAL domain-containing protein [Hoeflea sp.]|uniref:bifunctional diguanylate cyclase/phosphodiesterase n=1 Tax=Hoeflea sp. TaxID=1940281 RepID=UPI0032F06F92